jgi:hypothetical protein
MTHKDLWLSALNRIKPTIKKAHFLTWFQGTTVLRIDEGVAVIGVPTTFARNWLSDKYNLKIGFTDGNSEGITSLSDYAFMGTGYGPFTANSTPAPGIIKPYVPKIIIDENKIIWVHPDGKGDGSAENTPTTLQKSIINAKEGDTIIALNGDYIIGMVIRSLSNVNIIAKNKLGAKIIRANNKAVFYFEDKSAIHDINIIGFEADGNKPAYDGKDDSYFIFHSGALKNDSVYNIYISDMKFHNFTVALYGGLHSHDWTLDRVEHYDSTLSYLWYMMGWHHSVINSVMYNNSYLSLAIRGCFPIDETYIYSEKGDIRYLNNPRISSRNNHFLSQNDWTHIIINNTFGTNFLKFRLSRQRRPLFRCTATPKASPQQPRSPSSANPCSLVTIFRRKVRSVLY